MDYSMAADHHYALLERSPEQPSSYGLDVWASGVKVLRLLGGVDGGDIEVGSYELGPWKREMEAL